MTGEGECRTAARAGRGGPPLRHRARPSPQRGPLGGEQPDPGRGRRDGRRQGGRGRRPGGGGLGQRPHLRWTPRRVRRAIERANRAIRRMASEDPDKSGMGTTMTAALVRDDQPRRDPRGRLAGLPLARRRPPPGDRGPLGGGRAGAPRQHHRRGGREPPPPQRDHPRPRAPRPRSRPTRSRPASARATSCCCAATASRPTSPRPTSRRSSPAPGP